MNTQSAVLLVGTIYALTEFFKRLNLTSDGRIVQVVSMVIAVGTVFLVASSDWGKSQLVDGKALDTLNTGSKLLAGLVLGAGANLLHTTVGAIKNVGENQPE